MSHSNWTPFSLRYFLTILVAILIIAVIVDVIITTSSKSKNIEPPLVGSLQLTNLKKCDASKYWNNEARLLQWVPSMTEEGHMGVCVMDWRNEVRTPKLWRQTRLSCDAVINMTLSGGGMLPLCAVLLLLYIKVIHGPSFPFPSITPSHHSHSFCSFLLLHSLLVTALELSRICSSVIVPRSNFQGNPEIGFQPYPSYSSCLSHMEQ